MNDFFSLYDTLLSQVDCADPVVRCEFQEYWALAETAGGAGIAMATGGDSISPLHPAGLAGLPLREAAAAVKSWNLPEASCGLAAINAALNTKERLERFHCYLPFERHYTEGMDFAGKTVGIVGHMRGPAVLRETAKEVFILERSPHMGDYPDSACEFLLPRCDIVLITGSTLINKTLPRLLELCRQAYVVLTGPSVPLCPELLEHGIDRMAGLVLTDRDGIRVHVEEARPRSPMGYGKPFVLKK